jgi:mono/diheme cytochrome c family protein
MNTLTTILALLAQADEYASGLAFRAGDSPARPARLAALRVPVGASPAAPLPPGPFQASWTGFVSVDLGTDVVFSASGSGAAKVVVNGKTALDAADLAAASEGASLRLKKGRNALRIDYRSPARGEAAFRLFWASGDFAREPVPPQALSVKRSDLAGVHAAADLALQRRCLKCHGPDLKGAPELEMDAPSLLEAGTRMNRAWMEAWIRDPRSIRPEATMPRLVGAEEAADLAAYLATLGAPAADPQPAPEDVVAGGVLFAELRCVGCHTLPEREPAPDRIPFRHLKAKWRPAALQAFLKAPQQHYAWIEMPDFRLTDIEAARISAFLLSRNGATVDVGGAGDPAKGKALAETKGCMSCHRLPGTNAHPPRPLASFKGACKGGDFGLGDAEWKSLETLDTAHLKQEVLPEFLARQMKALRCTACHKRDERADLWTEIASETKDLLPKKEDDGEFVEVAPAEPWFPSLTWIGDKLKPEWTAAFLRGDPALARPRPYLKSLRMPAFASRAERLAKAFALEHGTATTGAPEPAPDAEQAELGRRLAGPTGGLDCLSCHGIGPKGATKVFEAPAPNFALARERLTKEYFERWVREPLRLEPGTKMPQFIKDGRTQLTEVLDGDGVKQVEALWQYLLEGAKIRPPGE